MHSRIFNLTTKHQDEDELFERLVRVNGAADYLVSSEDIDGDIEWLVECYELKCENKKIIVSKEKAQAYWNKRIDKIKELVNSDNFGLDDMFSLTELCNDVYTMYVILDGVGLLTIGELFRYIVMGYIKGTEFDVLETFDYHY